MVCYITYLCKPLSLTNNSGKIVIFILFFLERKQSIECLSLHDLTSLWLKDLNIKWHLYFYFCKGAKLGPTTCWFLTCTYPTVRNFCCFSVFSCYVHLFIDSMGLCNQMSKIRIILPWGPLIRFLIWSILQVQWRGNAPLR